MTSIRDRRVMSRLGAVLTGAVCVLGSSTALSTHSWGPYHWERSTAEANLALGDNLTGEWSASQGGYLNLAEIDWDASSILALAVVPGSPANLRRCSPDTGKIEICNDSYGYNGWLGIASILVQGEHIVAASVRVNDSYFAAAAYNTPEWRQFVMCQEVGHVFGLGHQDEVFGNANLGSCMDYTNNPASNLHPNSHDYALLESIYAHSDGSSGGSSGSDGEGPACKGGRKTCGNRGMEVSELRGELDLETPSQWGRLISEHGPQETYELDFGQGRKIITHVLWTLERAEQAHGH